MKKKVLLVAPIEGNGGIQSWTNKYLATFQEERYDLHHVPVSTRRSAIKEASVWRRIKDGLLDLLDVYHRVKDALNHHAISIMHTTTSGSLGSLRDYVLAKLCRRKGVKTIMHCRYGCICEDYTSRSLMGLMLRKTIALYDQIWVLDSRSEQFLKQQTGLERKVYLIPNSINVPLSCDLRPKEYKKIAFIGNLIPSKGLYELVSAVSELEVDIELFIVGGGAPAVVESIRHIAKDKYGTRILCLGPKPNAEAVRIMRDVDIVALPTYYKSEAFPISILEAMACGKMVVSTPRAAIADMLTAVDGERCGILVQEQSVEEIKNAILWCQKHPKAADVLCEKAYQKVRECYNTPVVYAQYINQYNLM